METDRDNGIWTALLPVALVLICCGGPVLLAAASAGVFVTMAEWLEGYRGYLVGVAAVLTGVAVYAVRRSPAGCCRPDEEGRARRLRRLGVAAWVGVVLLAIVAGLSVLVPGR